MCGVSMTWSTSIRIILRGQLVVKYVEARGGENVDRFFIGRRLASSHGLLQ
jgi:hypothetical protein